MQTSVGLTKAGTSFLVFIFFNVFSPLWSFLVRGMEQESDTFISEQQLGKKKTFSFNVPSQYCL